MTRKGLPLSEALLLAAEEHSPYDEEYPRAILSRMILAYGLPIRGVSLVLSHGVSGGSYSQPTLRRVIEGSTDPSWSFAQRVKTLDRLLGLKAEQGVLHAVEDAEYKVQISSDSFFELVHGELKIETESE